jgi:hypothetical protein
VTATYVQPPPGSPLPPGTVVAPVAPASAVHNWLKTGSIVSSAIAFTGGVISYITSLPSHPNPATPAVATTPYIQPPPATPIHPGVATTPATPATPPSYVQPPPVVAAHPAAATPDPTCLAILALLQAQAQAQHHATTPTVPSYVQPPPGPASVTISPTVLCEAATDLESYADAIDEPKRITPGVPPYWTAVMLPRGVTDPNVAVASIRATAKTLRASGARASP